MGVYLAGSYSQRPWPTSAARLASAIRRALAADRAVMRLPSRRRSVIFSPLADALAQLERIQIASPGYGLPVEPVGATGGALTSERVRLAAAGAGAGRARSVPYDGRRVL